MIEDYSMRCGKEACVNLSSAEHTDTHGQYYFGTSYLIFYHQHAHIWTKVKSLLIVEEVSVNHYYYIYTYLHKILSIATCGV